MAVDDPRDAGELNTRCKLVKLVIDRSAANGPSNALDRDLHPGFPGTYARNAAGQFERSPELEAIKSSGQISVVSIRGMLGEKSRVISLRSSAYSTDSNC